MDGFTVVRAARPLVGSLGLDLMIHRFTMKVPLCGAIILLPKNLKSSLMAEVISSGLVSMPKAGFLAATMGAKLGAFTSCKTDNI